MSNIFRLNKIEERLKSFQKDFPEINKKLTVGRDPVDDVLIENILTGYDFLNHLLERRIDIFSPAGLHSMLELNHIVLCGTSVDMRAEYYRHIIATRNKYNDNIDRIKDWVDAQSQNVDSYKLASGYYCRSLSMPQLFIEGNHRTGNLILNYLLVCRGVSPLVLSKDNAFQYLELSGKIKFSSKNKLLSNYNLLRNLNKQFREFLIQHVAPECHSTAEISS
jgi:hypothetical protein